MYSLRDLWDAKKPAPVDTPPTNSQNNSNKNEEEQIAFDHISDADEEAAARQLAPEQLWGG